jgi:membrane associated rhomboid family serine protease
MFIPIGDEPNPHHLPLMTVALIAVNVAVFLLVALPMSTRPADPADPLLAQYLQVLARQLPPGTSLSEAARQISAYDLFVFQYGFRVNAPGVITLFTSMFMHAGFMHLAGNMLYLWIYGNNVEHRLGSVQFLFWYLVTGVAAVVFHAAFNLRSPTPLVGASGAISGVLGFYLVWFPRNVVKVWMFLFPFYVGVVKIGALWVLGLYLVLDNLLPFLVARGEGGGVAHGAHIGGFLTGMAVAWIMDRFAARRAA